MRKTIGRVLGPLGALLILFGLLSAALITRSFSWPVLVELGLGVALVAAWGATAFEDARNVATGRGSMFIAVSGLSTALLVVILAAVNYVAVKKKVEWDMTKGGIHTLADQTTSILSKLTPESKVKVTAFYAAVEPQYAPLDELLKRYKAIGGENFEYEFVDATKNPQIAKQMGVSGQGARIVMKGANGKEARAKDVSEESLTNALSELSKGVEKKIYFLTAHGEKPTGKGNDTALGLKLWTDGLVNEGFKSEELNLMARKDVPEDALAVVIAGPQSPLSDGERDAVKRYADAGGRLVILADPGYDTNLDSLLAGWGVELQKGTVVDPESQEALWAFTQEFSDHPLATPRMTILGALAFVFPEARGVKKGAGGDSYTVTELFKTGKGAWGETAPLPADGKVSKDASDDAGPINLAVAVTKKLDGDKEFRAVVVGDSDWATNQYIRQGGNRDFALNAIQWLGGQESKITIRPKLREKSTLAFLSANQQLLLYFGSLNVLPLVLIAFGLSVWSLRKSK